MYAIDHGLSRTEIEMRIMGIEFPHFQYFETLDESYFWGWHVTGKSHHRILLKLLISSNYPDKEPSLFVLDPQKLIKHNGGTINDLQSSHDYHTYKNGPGGTVQICHHPHWDPSCTCSGVIYKGLLWCEAYDEHRTSGDSIHNILEKMKTKMKKQA
jgi:hypothetical protein